MARSENQKLKLLYIVQLLQERTDEEHPVTTQEIIDYLRTKGIAAERKSIYTDIELLTDYGRSGREAVIWQVVPLNWQNLSF